MERKNKNFMKPLWFVPKEKEDDPRKRLPTDDDSLKEYVKKLKKERKLDQIPMKQWKSDWNIAGYTQRRRNYLDWKGIKEHERDYVLEDQDGYPLDEFLNKRSEKEKPYVRPLTNLRFKGHIIRRIVDNKDEWNAASIPERQAILKEIMRTVPGSERVNVTGLEKINF